MLNTSQNFVYKLLNWAEKGNRYIIWNKIEFRKLFSQILRRSISIFKENYVFIEEEDNRSEKVIMVEEEPDGIDIDNIRNLLDLPSLYMLTLWQMTETVLR